MASAVAAIIQHSELRVVPRRISVLTVDGHEVVQEGLAALIDREEDMTVVAAASSGEEAMSAVRRYRPDVVTLDLLLPDMPGQHLARRILAESPDTGIVAITSAQGHIEARRALDSTRSLASCRSCCFLLLSGFEVGALIEEPPTTCVICGLDR